MSVLSDVPRKEINNRFFGVLTDDIRRRTLRTLRQRKHPLTVNELVESLLTEVTEQESEPRSSDEAEELQLQLRHIHLPKLDECELIEWDRGAHTVRAVDHPVLNSSHIQQLLSRDGEISIGEVLDNHRRREILAVIELKSHPLTRDDLARTIAMRNSNGEQEEEIIDDIATQLHHIHLPKLELGGLIDYNHSDAMITYQGPPELPSLVEASI